jgi:hypothetical protein
MPQELEWRRTIEIGHDIRMDASIEVTVRGNGGLKIANLDLRVFDEYEDTRVFDPPLLHIEFADVTGDGYKDLILVGTVKHLGEKEWDPVTTEPVCSIYIFDPAHRQFIRTYRCGPALED